MIIEMLQVTDYPAVWLCLGTFTNKVLHKQQRKQCSFYNLKRSHYHNHHCYASQILSHSLQILQRKNKVFYLLNECQQKKLFWSVSWMAQVQWVTCSSGCSPSTDTPVYVTLSSTVPSFSKDLLYWLLVFCWTVCVCKCIRVCLCVVSVW